MYTILNTYQFHQRFNTKGAWVPVKYDPKTKLWQSCNHYNSSSRIQILLVFIAKSLLLAIAAINIYTAIQAPNYFNNYHIVAQTAVILLVLVVLAVDIILLTHGEMLIFSCNWAHRMTKLQECSKNSAKFVFRTVTTTAVLLAFFTYLNTGLYVHVDMDPWYILTKCLRYYLPKQFKTLSCYQYLIWKLARYVFSLWVAHGLLVCPITLTILATSQFLHRCVLIKNLEKHLEPSLKSTNFYRQFSIMSNAMRSFELDLTNFALTSMFILCLLFFNVFVVGVRQSSIMFEFLGFLVACFFLVILHIIFVIGCLFYSSSVKILQQWKSATKNRSKYFDKILKSLPLIALPAGEAGIIDVEIKVNYFYSLLENTTNSVLTIQSMYA